MIITKTKIKSHRSDDKKLKLKLFFNQNKKI